MKTGPDALDTVENEYGRAKHENWKSKPSISPKTSLSAQNMKMGPDNLGTAENDSKSAKHENGTRCPQ
jgi:hypothetical protein